MPKDRISLAEHELQGGTNLSRARRRLKDETPLSLDQKEEIAAVDKLIAKVLKAARHGSTWKGKSNPAFSQLLMLTRTRTLLMKGHTADPGKKSAAELLRDVDKLLSEDVN